jgi:hypothetical protein
VEEHGDDYCDEGGVMSPELAAYRQLFWTTSNGKSKPISELETSHILNILNWVKLYPEQYAANTYALFEEEVAYRMLIDFANGAPTPHKDEDGQWGYLDPVANRKRAAKDAATKLHLLKKKLKKEKV